MEDPCKEYDGTLDSDKTICCPGVCNKCGGPGCSEENNCCVPALKESIPETQICGVTEQKAPCFLPQIPYNIQRLDLAFNPEMRQLRENKELEEKEEYDRNFGQIDIKESYRNLFELLWYSQLPCFDIRNLTSRVRDEISVVKRCYWKGLTMSCSSLFSMRPTDRGMCCSFNTANVDSIFKEGSYTDEIKKMEQQDKDHSFEDSNLPEWYVDQNEPVPHPGQDKGLRLVLDAHSDLVSSGSVGDRFRGFLVLIEGNNDYPLSSRRSFILRSGNENLVQISASQVYGTKGSKNHIKPLRRGCYFSDEYELEMYKEYSQDNCILECSLRYARSQINLENGTTGCTPWFYPTPEEHVHLWCNPWETETFQKHMTSIPDKECSYCMPDCNSTDYEFAVTSSPFRKCDHTNLGTSELCDLKWTHVNPPIWSQQVQDEYSMTMKYLPEYIKPNDLKMQNRRKYADSDEVANSAIFQKSMEAEPTYDAFTRDISIVNFYFSRPTVTQFKRAERLTWTDYISQIGGLLGLALGFSIISAVEIIYWVTIRLGRNICAATNPKNKVHEWASPRNQSARQKHEKVVALMKQKDASNETGGT